MKLETIYDLLIRQDSDFRVCFGDRHLTYDGTTYRVFIRNACDPVYPILLLETESEAVAVGVLSGHYAAF